MTTKERQKTSGARCVSSSLVVPQGSSLLVKHCHQESKQNSSNRSLGVVGLRRLVCPSLVVSRPSLVLPPSAVPRPSRLGQLGSACPRTTTSHTRALQAAELQPILEGGKNFEIVNSEAM